MPNTLSKSNAEIKNSLLLTSLFQKRKKNPKRFFFKSNAKKTWKKHGAKRGWLRRRYIGSQFVDRHHGSPSTRKQRKLNSRHKSIIPFARSFVPDQFRCPFTGSKRAVSICGWACGTILSAEQRSIGQSRGSGESPHSLRRTGRRREEEIE